MRQDIKIAQTEEYIILNVLGPFIFLSVEKALQDSTVNYKNKKM